MQVEIKPIPESVTREDILKLCRLLYMLINELAGNNEEYLDQVDDIIKKLNEQ